MESDSVAPAILYEDNHVIAVNKPPGMLSQGDLSGDLDVLTAVKEHIKRRDQKPGNVFLGLVHRLDRPVGGVMVIAKTSKAAGRLSSQFRERAALKIYRAAVSGEPGEQEATLEHFLQKDRATRITRVVADGASGKPARLAYRVMEVRPPLSLLEITLMTGLSHQIRVQLAAIGHPVAGDRKYGSKLPHRQGEIALYAHSIAFEHPVKKTPVTVIAHAPSGWPF